MLYICKIISFFVQSKNRLHPKTADIFQKIFFSTGPFASVVLQQPNPNPNLNLFGYVQLGNLKKTQKKDIVRRFTAQ